MELDSYLVSQLLAGIAIIFYLVTFQFKNRSQILFCMSASAFFNAAHFLLLGIYPAALLALISMSRSITAYCTTRKALLGLFVVVALVAFGITYQRPIQWLLLAASLLATWASFQSKDRTIRLVFMLTTALWLVHNLWIVSYAGILLEALFLVSNIISYRRFYMIPFK